jgi:monofunctional biosynthetic peptidoglycan transglycosylase
MIKRLILASILAGFGAVWFYYIALPWPLLLRMRNPGTTSLMDQRAAEARDQGESLEIRQDWVPLENISRRLRRAVIIGEDARFYDHDGVDWNALQEEFRYRGDGDFSWFDGDDLRALAGSARYYREHRASIRGRSTITQQLAKNLYFSTARSELRKFEELIVTGRLERVLSKDRILEIYLNVVEWGPGIFGVEAASRHYFKRSARDLTADQAAALAATLPHPLSSNPRTRPGRMLWRKGLILARMGATGPVQTVPLAPEPDTVKKPVGTPLTDTTSVRPDTAIIRPDTTVRPDTAMVRPDTSRVRTDTLATSRTDLHREQINVSPQRRRVR